MSEIASQIFDVSIVSQPFAPAQIEEKIKTFVRWNPPFDRWTPLTKGQ